MSNIDNLSVATIRVLSADVVQGANSGHPGAPMGMAVMAHTLWSRHLNLNPKNPKWINRDRFVLSNGHASALMYTMLHLAGYDFWTMDKLQKFRQLHNPAAGHPESVFPGIEVTTGPLGQGISNAVGLAMGEAHMAARFNKDNFKVFDHYTYVFCGDGCLQEGVSSEASSIAGHLGLGKLIVLYDDNNITIDGHTELSFTEDVLKRYESYGWHVQHVSDGNTDLEAIHKAIEVAKSVTDKPSLIKVTTIIGYGAPKQNTHGIHGSPVGEADLKIVKEKFGFDPSQKYVVPDDVKAFYGKSLGERGAKLEEAWNALLGEYAKAYPQLAAELKRRTDQALPEGWEASFPTFKPSDPAAATRITSGNILNHAASLLPEIFGGSADLNPSCFTYLKSDKDFQKGAYSQRNVRFGVREHAMAAICNGLAAYGTFIPFCSTFLNFIGYAYGAVILSGLSHLRVLYVFTHDSIFLGEDGPTHQPIEKYAAVRATPNIHFIRPADGNEVSAAYISAIKSVHTPTVMSLSRQNVPNLAGTSIEGALKGGYIVADSDKPDIILVGTGSELHLCVQAKEKVNARVVSLPCWELFDAQPEEYRRKIFPSGVPVLSVEAGTTSGWSKYAHASIGIDVFGLSGTISDLAKHFGFTVDNVVERANQTIAFFKGKTVESRLDTLIFTQKPEI
uniref:Transketolase n=1 Tax=Arcella intermedia TaxID=1963864 RepID=A0A6B2KZ44_9EUKA